MVDSDKTTAIPLLQPESGVIVLRSHVSGTERNEGARVRRLSGEKCRGWVAPTHGFFST